MPEARWADRLRGCLAARERLRPHLARRRLRSYAALGRTSGRRIQVLVKHENHNPTNAFKARNGLAAVSALTPEERRRGVAGARRHHGQGLAFAAASSACASSFACPPPPTEKVEAIRGFGAEIVEHGLDYSAAVEHAAQLAREQALTLVHSTECPAVLAGAGTSPSRCSN